MISEKDRYRKLCDDGHITKLFSQDWWLDIVCCKGEWNSIVVEDNDKIIAAMPYYQTKKYMFDLIAMPKLTPMLGPHLFCSTFTKHNKKLSFEKKIFNHMIERLPRYDYFCQSFNYNVMNWLPFYWKGFSQRTQYSYIIDLSQDQEEIFAGFESNMKNKIRKALKIVTLKKGMAIKDFYSLNSLVFARQGIKIPYQFDLIHDIDNVLEKKGQREIFYAVDARGNIHSAIYLVWDNRSCYLHLVGEDPEFRNSGAGIALIWEAINFAKTHLKLKRFDFEGSMIENVEIVRRSCAGIQTPYFVITKINSLLLKVGLALRK